MIISDKLNKISSDIRGEIYMQALKLENEGNKILKLNTGNPAAFGFKMPESIKERITKDMELSLGYCDIKGMEKSRYAIEKYHRSKGIKNISIDDIFIGNGVSETAYMIITSIIQNGDEILLPSPTYSLWSNLVTLSGGKNVFYKCDENNCWYPDTSDIINKITSKTKAIIIINPNNPTGAVYPDNILMEIIDIARKNNIIIISDEIYDRLVLDNKKYTSIASLTKDVTVITVNGLSKSHCICGLRCGWLLISGKEKEKNLLKNALTKIASIRLCSNSLMQLIIPDALNDTEYTEKMISKNGRLTLQRNAAAKELDKIDGLTYIKNDAAFYLFPKLDLNKYGFKDDKEFAIKLLNKKHILVIPGSGFNAQDKSHFRLVMLPYEKELKEAIKTIACFLKER